MAHVFGEYNDSSLFDSPDERSEIFRKLLHEDSLSDTAIMSVLYLLLRF